MTGRENRKARREAERKARKQAPQLAPEAPPPFSPEPPARQPHPETLAYMAAMRAKADRELDEEFGAEFMAHAREVSDRIARRTGLYNPDHNRAEANRQNAQLSTGPRTEQGKLASSRNSLKHGLSTGTLLIPGEDPAEFESLRDALRREHQPADTTEQLLVDGLAQSHWLLQRAIRFQNECFTAKGVDEKRLALFLRYGTTQERAFHKALSALIRLKKDRRKAQPAPSNGFVSQSEVNINQILQLCGAASQAAAVSQTAIMPETPKSPRPILEVRKPFMPDVVRCPICDRSVPFEDPNMPFCSDRCRLVDLGNWATEKYVVSSADQPSDLEDLESPSRHERS